MRIPNANFSDLPFYDTQLSIEARIDDLISRLTLEEKISLMPCHQRAVERLGIEEFIIGGEAAHGIAWMGIATSYPQPIGMSCTWNPNLMYKIGDAIGDEARIFYKKHSRKQGLTLWAPTIDLERDPRWGRTEEGYGEDPYLVSKMARALVKGMQGGHPTYKKTLSTIKHYMGNNNEKNRLTSSSNIDNRNKMEYYIKPFYEVIKDNGAYSVMPAYNEVNHLPCILDPDLKSLLRQDYGLNGYIVSDATDMKMLVDFHKYCYSYAEAVALSIKSGVDSINDEPELVINSVQEALKRHLIEESHLDEALRNTFKGRFQIGQFDPQELNPYNQLPESILCCSRHAELSLQAARESIVLLKNDNELLPLQKENINITILGPLSDQLYRDWYSGDFPYTISPLEGIQNELKNPLLHLTHHKGSNLIAIRSRKSGKYVTVDEVNNFISIGLQEKNDKSTIFELEDWGDGAITLKSILNHKYLTASKTEITATAEEIGGWFVKEVFKIEKQGEGYSWRTWNGKFIIESNNATAQIDENTEQEGNFDIEILSDGLEISKQMSANADYAVVFVGNHPMINGKEDCDRPSLLLPQRQSNLIEAVHQNNPNTIVCVISSYPYAINDLQEQVPSILYMSHGSQELGKAISDIIFGNHSPAGRLPMTWYQSEDQLPSIMDYDIIKGKRTYMYFEDKPLYPFGHGLTYANFLYENFKIHSESFKETDILTLSFQVTNKSKISSADVVQLYVKKSDSRVKRPLLELKTFEKIWINAGATITTALEFPISELTFWDVTRERYCLEQGEYELLLGRSSKDIKFRHTFTVNSEKIPPRELSKVTKAENYDDYHGIEIIRKVDGTQHVVATRNDSWIMFDKVHIDSNLMEIQLFAKFLETGGLIELRSDTPQGTIIGSTSAKINECFWTTYNTTKNEVHVERLYVILSKGTELNWFVFK